MSGKVEEIDFLEGQHTLAAAVSSLYHEWSASRETWIEEKKELRKYIVATDTTKTSNSALPWKNKTTLPKLTQIRDNLHANYMAALFPNDDWITWLALAPTQDLLEKRQAIEAYSKNKLNTVQFKEVVANLVLDYIDYGNAFAMVTFEDNIKVDQETGEEIANFIGPKVVRISPYDIVFNPTAPEFTSATKIVRYVKSIGELLKDTKNQPALGYDQSVVDELIEDRQRFATLSPAEQDKATGYAADGFSNFQGYFGSSQVEILELYGDLYNLDTGELHEDSIITVADGKYILRNETDKSWFDSAPIRHIGWRKRSDNLWAMGPLDNIVGMQYRIDHLENLKADVFDMIAHPVLKVVGDVPSNPKWGPGETWDVGDEGDVVIVHPDTTALNADLQIQLLEQKMEEMAGAPKQAAGFRTPGEKTKYEVQVLERGAGRVFQAKIDQFEATFLEPLINIMIEQGIRNHRESDLIRVLDADTGAEDFLKVTKEDLTSAGRLVPQGARHFAEDAKFIQDVSTFAGGLGQDQGVRPHWSGKAVTKLIFDKLGHGEIFGDNISVDEMLKTQQLVARMQDNAAANAATETDVQPEDLLPDA